MQVTFNTNLGAITIDLNAEKAPVTVANFVKHAKSGYYTGTIFHRVINNFMIQGGGFNKDMQQKPTEAEIANEADNGLKNDKYTVAMARTSAPHSASSQFFINVKSNDFLNFTSKDGNGWGYAVFGKVTTGTDIVDLIKGVKTKSNSGHDDVPIDPVIIESVSVVE